MPDTARELVGIGLGGNIGGAAGAIAAALAEIEGRGVGRVVAVSSLWRTPPWGRVDQPAFLNACALVETTRAPLSLLAALKAIEADIGRRATQRWGPRLIDLDILFYGDRMLDAPDLAIPHRDLLRRAFVLAPLAEIAADRIISGARVRDALEKVDRAGLEIVEPGDAWRWRARGEKANG